MIICSCNVVSDHEVRIAMVAEAPPRTPGQLYRCLGFTAQCGRCTSSIKRIMREPAGGEHRAHASRRSGQSGHRHKT
jgi:bacterioferritin-associated ferredoxin